MNNLCTKCNGTMVVNTDKDLSCLMCGSVLVLNVRRQTDIAGIRKKVEIPATCFCWRMSSEGKLRRKEKPRKFLGSK